MNLKIKKLLLKFKVVKRVKDLDIFLSFAQLLMYKFMIEKYLKNGEKKFQTKGLKFLSDKKKQNKKEYYKKIFY